MQPSLRVPQDIGVSATADFSRGWRPWFGGTVGLGMLVCCGCFGGPSRLVPPSVDPDLAGQQAVAQYDHDGDDLLSKKELASCPGILNRMEQFDTDQDEHVSADEIAQRIHSWRESKVALMPLSVRVTLNGKPLAGADVKLVPESFLGDAVKPAAGRTDAHGMATPAIASEELPDDLADVEGVHLGIYQVEVSHPKKKLPRKRLGTEVNHLDQWNGIRFDLSSR